MAPTVTALPRTVWALGLVSLCMDASSEIVHALLPLFLTTTLGASALMLGLIDGIAEATAALGRVAAGWLSDRSGRRKPLILAGYGLGAAAKLLFPLASSALLVLGARFVDRVGKGLRGAPRDALVADVTPVGLRGRAYGLRQALDTVGAFIGPLAAIGLMYAFANDMRSVLWCAVIPALLSVLVIVFGVRDAAVTQPAERRPLVRGRLRELSAEFWWVVAIGVVFTLARFSEAFLILAAHERGLPLALAPLVLVVMNVVYACAAYPAGALADRRPAWQVLGLGLAVLVLADVMLAIASGLIGTFAGIALWGLHLALTQGLLAKLVAEHAATALRATAFGLFHLASAAALLAASVIAGALWDRHGADATFAVGAVFALAAFALVVWRR